MCGRYALTTPPQVLAALFRLARPPEPVRRFNVAPTQLAPVMVQREDGSREAVAMKWGLIPFWSKEAAIGSRLINARSESAHEKPAFRAAFKQRRCIVPITGFYEWQKLGAKAKQPFYIYRADGKPMAVAGLWESWTDPESGTQVRTFTILTTEANSQLRPLHDRMPLILEPEDVDRWLNLKSTPEQLASLMQPAAEGVLSLHAVSSRVNAPKNDDPSLIEPAMPTAGVEAEAPAMPRGRKKRSQADSSAPDAGGDSGGGLFD